MKCPRIRSSSACSQADLVFGADGEERGGVGLVSTGLASVAIARRNRRARRLPLRVSISLLLFASNSLPPCPCSSPATVFLMRQEKVRSTLPNFPHFSSKMLLHITYSDLFYRRRKDVSKELYDLFYQGYADLNLIAKWNKWVNRWLGCLYIRCTPTPRH